MAQKNDADKWQIPYLDIYGYFAQQVHSQQLQQSHMRRL